MEVDAGGLVERIDSGRERADTGGEANDSDAGSLEVDATDSGVELTPSCDVATQHACGLACVDNGPNDPSNGCSQSCSGDPCPEVVGGSSSCTTEGHCSVTCDFPWFPNDTGSCACISLICDETMCGTYPDTCGGTIDCGECGPGSVGATTCALDSYEPTSKDHPYLASAYYTLTDSSGDYSSTSIEGGLISSVDDEDWYRYRLLDGDDSGNPRIRAVLTGPNASSFNIGAYYTCDEGRPFARACDAGVADDAVGAGCFALGTAVEFSTDCDIDGSWIDDTDENGYVYIRVTAAPAVTTCESYSFYVEVR